MKPLLLTGRRVGNRKFQLLTMDMTSCKFLVKDDDDDDDDDHDDDDDDNNNNSMSVY
jgi:hypothetical protein